ncbi:MAG: ferredoxin reductase [Thermoleophilaceae bacterium]|nr:ferredoxin reductase [Thermoleophilaceae bacterium]
MYVVPESAAPLRLGRRLFQSRTLETIVSPNGIDRYGQLLDPTFSVHRVLARVEQVRRQTAGSVTLTLRPNANWLGFEAGQHVGVGVEVDGVVTTRYYSPASSAEDDRSIEITVALHPDGVVSPDLYYRAVPGEIVSLTQAFGEFTLPDSHAGDLLLICGGSGITPLMSMLRTLHAQGHVGTVTLVSFAPTRADDLYVSELKQLGAEMSRLQVVRGHTREHEPGGTLTGHISAAKIKRICPRFAEIPTYVCGPPRLVAATERIWKAAGASASLKSESFTLPELKLDAADATGTLAFTESGISVDNSGATLLDQAEAAGIAPTCGCRIGVCHACDAHVKSGAARDVRSGKVRALSNERVQLCVNAPVGDFELFI